VLRRSWAIVLVRYYNYSVIKDRIESFVERIVERLAELAGAVRVCGAATVW
jgi:hypothetical protein